MCGPWSYLSNTGRPKKLAHFLYVLTSYAITSSNIHRFSNLFYCLNQENICNNTVTKDPATPQMCRYTTVTTLWNVNVLKPTIENKTTSVGTYFRKLTTGNNMFIISVIFKTSCRILHFCIKCSMCQSCCWTTHSYRIRLVSIVAFKTPDFTR